MKLDPIDRKLLNLVQTKFPIVPEPYRELAEKLNITEQEVLSRLRCLMETDIIRRFGGVFNSRSLGYKGTLCAMKVPPERVDEITALINNYVAITQNYLRDHQYNIWFTVLTDSSEKTADILQEIIKKTGINDLLNLPAERFFKVLVNFELDEG